MESEEMKEGPPKGQDIECGMAWERVSVVDESYQETKVPVKSGVPARDTRTNQVYMYNVRWKNKLSFMPLISVVTKDIYQQETKC